MRVTDDQVRQAEEIPSAKLQQISLLRLRISTRSLWTGCTFAVLVLIAIPACILLPPVSHASAEPSGLIQGVAFNPYLPVLIPGGVRAAMHPAIVRAPSTGFLPAVLPTVNQRVSISAPPVGGPVGAAETFTSCKEAPAKAWHEQDLSRDHRAELETSARDYDGAIVKPGQYSLEDLLEKQPEAITPPEKEMQQIGSKKKQSEGSKQQSERDKERNRQTREKAAQGLPYTEWQFGDEHFGSLAAARARTRDILRAFTGEKALPCAEFRVIYDIIQRHPDRVQKRTGDVTSISVGRSQKFPARECFWIWHSDGSGEDISIRKCLRRHLAL